MIPGPRLATIVGLLLIGVQSGCGGDNADDEPAGDEAIPASLGSPVVVGEVSVNVTEVRWRTSGDRALSVSLEVANAGAGEVDLPPFRLVCDGQTMAEDIEASNLARTLGPGEKNAGELEYTGATSCEEVHFVSGSGEDAHEWTTTPG